MGEKEANRFSSLRVSAESIRERFGIRANDGNFETRNELEPFAKINNLILPDDDTPGIDDHNPKIEIGKDFRRNNFYAILKDTIFLRSEIQDDRERRGFRLSLFEEVVEAEESKDLSLAPHVKLLGLRSNVLPGWEFDYHYYNGALDYGPECWLRFVKKEDQSRRQSLEVKLDVAGDAPNFEVSVPFRGDFDENLAQTRDVLRNFVDVLGLPFTPELKYKFAFSPGYEIQNPAVTSSDFVDYFYRNLKNWNSFPGPKILRGVINRGKDGRPILLLEDTVLGSRTSLDNLASGYTASFDFQTTVRTHDDIINSFHSGISEGLINPSLASVFPEPNWRQPWIHMFIDVNASSGIAIREDVESNLHSTETNNLIQETKVLYKINYGARFLRETAEKMAKSPMLMPKINIDSAIIREKYGSRAAKLFRRAAIGWLINSDVHSKDVYDAYNILLKGEREKKN